MEEVEIWKDIPEYEGLYQVSNFGRVKSLNYRRLGKEKILKLSKNSDEYLCLNLYKDGEGKTFTVHRLVALTFLKNPENLPCINHKDENKQNNHVDNLEFCSIQYNNCYGTRLERFSKSMKGKNKGKHLSEETKQKISIANKGYIPSNRKSILQYTLDGVFIREWDSIKSASKELNINIGNICMCCKSKYKSAGGFIWRYKE